MTLLEVFERCALWLLEFNFLCKYHSRSVKITLPLSESVTLFSTSNKVVDFPTHLVRVHSTISALKINCFTEDIQHLRLYLAYHR